MPRSHDGIKLLLYGLLPLLGIWRGKGLLEAVRSDRAVTGDGRKLL